MCGIAGIFGDGVGQPGDQALLARLAARLRHRGPDGEGARLADGYGLVHRRLAIVDLATGQQPMHDGSGRVWIVFNGEIYNHLALRAQLEQAGFLFRTRSDTEVLLHGWQQWGERLPEMLRGMFAFALVDETQQLLFAARDRLGKKPFHYRVDGPRFAFASELKALHELPGAPRSWNGRALARFLVLRYVPDPDTIWNEVHKLPPAHALTFRRGQVRLWRYWRLSFAEPWPETEPVLAERALMLLDEATRIRLMSEVPLGAFLSGGIDSQAVADSIRRGSGSAPQLCTVGFPDRRFDERPQARAAARRLGAMLHEGEVSADDLLDLDWHPETFDEPFSDSSSIPTWQVSRIARRHVTVALSGDGGDEAFAGYRRYRFDALENQLRALLPSRLWRGLAALYPKADYLPRALRFKRTLQNLGADPALAYARSVCASLPEQVLPLLRPEWARSAGDPLEPLRAAYLRSDAPDPLGRAAATDYETWLPGDILTKVDRASMACSLEVRAPFLDHELVQFAARIPSRLKLAGGRTKAFLRAALRERVAARTLQARKQGFSVPLRKWLRGTVGALLRDDAYRRALDPFVDHAAVLRLLQRHQAGTADHGELLWSCVVLAQFVLRWGR
jgi:asparagine synthase (glutamine-hydrolysing)